MKTNMEFYVLYCNEDKTYLSYNTNFWVNDVLKAIKYSDINKAKEVKSHYDKTIQISKVSIDINENILT